MTRPPESEFLAICLRDVPADTQARARLALLDWLGCVLAARRSDVARALTRAMPGKPDDLLARAFDARAMDAQSAALATGALGNILEMDDLHRGALVHPGDTVCAASLAVALRRPTAGRDLLTAIARGYEAAIRIGRAAAAAGYTPFYNSGTCGVFGAAVASAVLHGLDEDGVADALGQAGMQAAGVWQCRLEPTYSKQLACAHAARAGVLSAELAAAGFPGARAILTGEMGVFAAYYPDARRDALTEDAGEGWAIEAVSFKPFAACRHTHPAISAALALRESAGAAPASIEVATYRAALDFCDRPAPRTPDEARFSLQHAVAVTLARGAPGIADFEGEALSDPEIASLRNRVRLRIDPDLDSAFPDRFGAVLTATGADGRSHEEACPAAWGDPENPMSEKDLCAKFHANALHGGVSGAAADRLLRAILDLPRTPDLSGVATALADALTPELETA